jgi:hypothetical protein
MSALQKFPLRPAFVSCLLYKCFHHALNFIFDALKHIFAVVRYISAGLEYISDALEYKILGYKNTFYFRFH